MPLFEITNTAFRPIAEASLTDLKLRERGDLQRLLRTQIDVIADDIYVLTEEFGEWEDSRRRIDLLGIDKQANLVVIELKRTTDGGHMDLQAIRYASMVSTLTFEKATQIHSDFLEKIGENAGDAQSKILEFLGWDEADEENFAGDVRIVLISEDFGKELTSAVLWLRDREINISCIRLRPYADGNTRLVDVQQIIPLPEANEYQVQLREKEQKGRQKRAERFDIRQKFWEGLIALARKRRTRHAEIKPGPYHWLGASSGVRGLNFNYVIVQEYGMVELYIDRGNESENKNIYDNIFAKRASIEAVFPHELSWERLDEKRACRIKHLVDLGGYRSPEVKWPDIQSAMVERMVQLEIALRPSIDELKL
ncbi:MAG: DUF4268 domain-containing protein [Opitutaceae bacterium]